MFLSDTGPYLIVVTKKQFVGDINGHAVYEVQGTELISFSKTNIHLSEAQVSISIAFSTLTYLRTLKLFTLSAERVRWL